MGILKRSPLSNACFFFTKLIISLLLTKHISAGSKANFLRFQLYCFEQSSNNSSLRYKNTFLQFLNTFESVLSLHLA